MIWYDMILDWNLWHASLSHAYANKLLLGVMVAISWEGQFRLLYSQQLNSTPSWRYSDISKLCVRQNLSSRFRVRLHPVVCASYSSTKSHPCTEPKPSKLAPAAAPLWSFLSPHFQAPHPMMESKHSRCEDFQSMYRWPFIHPHSSLL